MKRKTPSTANMKKDSISKANALNRDGIEKIMVWIRAFSPFALFKSLKSLLTLRTLRTLASCGAIFKNLRELVDSRLRMMSNTLVETMKKSNLFQPGLKYAVPLPIILKVASMTKAPANVKRNFLPVKK